MKYILYARKSTESEDRQAKSIGSQIDEMNQIAQRENLNIVEVLQESKSAKAPGRPVFEAMLKKIEKGQADGIVCWKMDRLARNPVDAGTIQWLLQNEHIKHIKTYERDYYPDDNVVMACIEFGMANQYIRDLSKNVRRGNRAKLEQGGWPGMAPFGYLNDSKAGTIIIDKDRARYVKQMFSLYALGTHSFEDIADILYENGLRTKGGGKVGKSVLHRVFDNTFYYGLMERGGTFYKGNHIPIISKQLFDSAHNARANKNDSRKRKRFFAYRGFLNCASCGCVLTPDKQKGHTYYFCTDGKKKCDQHKKYLKNEEVEKIIAKTLEDVHFDDEVIEISYLAAKEQLESRLGRSEDIQQTLAKQLELNRTRQTKLLDSYLDGVFTKEAYETKLKELQKSQADTESQLEKITLKSRKEFSTFEPTKKIFLCGNKAKKDFLTATDEKKRHHLEILLSNLTIQDKDLAQIRFKMPYQLLADTPKNADIATMSGRRDSNPV
ncbi:MAG: recombinase family protein [Candidatus Moranbacteria bacterium]|nr:recombinase family protein [Candidatus Moranbacteria bacterium]